MGLVHAALYISHRNALADCNERYHMNKLCPPLSSLVHLHNYPSKIIMNIFVFDRLSQNPSKPNGVLIIFERNVICTLVHLDSRPSKIIEKPMVFDRFLQNLSKPNGFLMVFEGGLREPPFDTLLPTPEEEAN